MPLLPSAPRETTLGHAAAPASTPLAAELRQAWLLLAAPMPALLLALLLAARLSLLLLLLLALPVLWLLLLLLLCLHHATLAGAAAWLQTRKLAVELARHAALELQLRPRQALQQHPRPVTGAVGCENACCCAGMWRDKQKSALGPLCAPMQAPSAPHACVLEQCAACTCSVSVPAERAACVRSMLQVCTSAADACTLRECLMRRCV